jgi:hypothetical protein
MTEARFKAAFVAMTPDADPDRHRCIVRTPMYELTSILVKNEEEAIWMCKELVEEDGVQSFILCPGFTNKGVAIISEAVGEGVSVNVARGDGPSNVIARRAMEEAGFFSRRG